MAPRALTALALAVTLLAGCGGDESDDDAAKGAADRGQVRLVETCLEEKYPGFVSSKGADLDSVAQVAKKGGVAVHTEDQEINISVHESPRVARAAERVYRGYDAQPALLERRGSAVIAYTREPTRRELRLITPCLGK